MTSYGKGRYTVKAGQEEYRLANKSEALAFAKTLAGVHGRSWVYDGDTPSWMPLARYERGARGKVLKVTP
jgi:hypothetical protein